VRTTLVDNLEKMAEKNGDIFILTGDLGFKLFDGFKAKHPIRFYDMGIAESNMIGVASGLSLCGKNVYCYSIIPFLVMRAYEQIRIDVAYHNLNVKLIGVGGGVTYGMEGFTHFGLEDFALMRALPNMTVVAPADPIEASQLASISVNYPGPLYMRLGKNGDPSVHKSKPNLKIGEGMIIREGQKVALFAIGNMVLVAREVCDKLSHRGIQATLINMHTIKPLDKKLIQQIASTHDEAIFTIEEHYIEGGLGSAVAEVLAEEAYSGIFKRFGIDRLGNHIGHADFLRNEYGLSEEKLLNGILHVLNGEE
jgi:transketolase